VIYLVHQCGFPRGLARPIAKTLAVAIRINSIEVPGRLAMQAAMSDLAAECGGAINMIREVQSPFEFPNIEPTPTS